MIITLILFYLKKAKSYFPYFVFIIFLTTLVPLVDKGSMVKLLNDNHHPWLDVFFAYWTHLGGGIPYIIMGITILIWFRPYVFKFLAAIILQMVISYGCKQIIFKHMARPSKWFSSQDWQNFHKIDGFIYHDYGSFPSGHTMAAFVSATFAIVYLTSNRILQIIIFISAFLVGISRIYLLQHFYMDVVFGAVLGSLCAICTVLIPNE